MSASNEIELFIREGLTRYADARDAVNYFEREVQDRLLAILEGKMDWSNFRGQRGERGRGKALSSGTWSGVEGRTIFASQLAKDEAEGSLELGLWWRSARARDGVLAYCNRWDRGYKARRIRLDDPKRPVECKPIGTRKPSLFVVLDPDANLETIGRLLLDEMDRALATSLPKKKND